MSEVVQGSENGFSKDAAKPLLLASLTLLPRQRQVTAPVEQTTWHSW
jgi:hypothetical protein